MKRSRGKIKNQTEVSILAPCTTFSQRYQLSQKPRSASWYHCDTVQVIPTLLASIFSWVKQEYWSTTVSLGHGAGRCLPMALNLLWPCHIIFLSWLREKKILVTYNYYPQNTLPKTTAFSHGIFLHVFLRANQWHTYISHSDLGILQLWYISYPKLFKQMLILF